MTGDTKMRDVEHIIVHCAATKADQYVDAAVIRDWHVNKNGWSDIGYHYVIRRDGVLELGRPIEQAGAHVKGFNYNSVGVCLAGGLDENGKAQDNFTIQQMDTLFYLVVTLTKLFPKADVKGHRDYSPDVNHDGQITPDEWMKECPCFDVNLWWQAVFKTM